jgi:hypothetical protein
MECIGITQRGERCRRLVNDDTILCWQHKYQKNILEEKMSPYYTPESGKKSKIKARDATSFSIPDLQDLSLSYLSFEELVDLFYNDYSSLDILVKKYYKDLDASAYKIITIEEGNLNLLKYLVYLGYKLQKIDIKVAIEYGQLNILRYIILEMSPYVKLGNSDLNLAIMFKHYNIVKYLIEKIGIVPDYQNLDNSALSGNLKIFKYLILKGLKPNRATLTNGIESGNLDMVKYLIDLEIRPSASQMLLATNLGYTEIVDYFRNLKVNLPKMQYL